MSIDKDALDEELLRQSNLAFRYGKKTADLRDRMDRAKLAMEVGFATVANAARNDPASYGIEKVTNDSINAAVLCDPDYQTHQDRWLAAKHDYEVTQAALNAIDSKRKCLDNLIKLLCIDYFSSEPSTLKINPEMRHRAKEKSRDRIRESLNKNKQVDDEDNF